MTDSQEYILGESLSVCPLNDAILNTAFAALDADGTTLVLLQNHLKELFRLQILALTETQFELQQDCGLGMHGHGRLSTFSAGDHHGRC